MFICFLAAWEPPERKLTDRAAVRFIVLALIVANFAVLGLARPTEKDGEPVILWILSCPNQCVLSWQSGHAGSLSASVTSSRSTASIWTWHQAGSTAWSALTAPGRRLCSACFWA